MIVVNFQLAFPQIFLFHSNFARYFFAKTLSEGLE